MKLCCDNKIVGVLAMLGLLVLCFGGFVLLQLGVHSSQETLSVSRVVLNALLLSLPIVAAFGMLLVSRFNFHCTTWFLFYLGIIETLTYMCNTRNADYVSSFGQDYGFVHAMAVGGFLGSAASLNIVRLVTNSVLGYNLKRRFFSPKPYSTKTILLWMTLIWILFGLAGNAHDSYEWLNQLWGISIVAMGYFVGMSLLFAPVTLWAYYVKPTVAAFLSISFFLALAWLTIKCIAEATDRFYDVRGISVSYTHLTLPTIYSV